MFRSQGDDCADPLDFFLRRDNPAVFVGFICSEPPCLGLLDPIGLSAKHCDESSGGSFVAQVWRLTKKNSGTVELRLSNPVLWTSHFGAVGLGIFQQPSDLGSPKRRAEAPVSEDCWRRGV